MKKFLLFLASSFAFGLVSCAESPLSSVPSSTASSFASEATISSAVEESSLEPISSLSSEIVSSCPWNELVQSNLLRAIGTTDLPYYEADEYVSTVKTSDDGVKIITIDCYPVDYGVAARNYKAICLENGYEAVDSTSYYCKAVSATDDVYLSFSVIRSTFTLEISAYRVQSRYTPFPSDSASLIVGGDLPMIEADYWKLGSSYAGVTSGGQTIYMPTLYGYAYGVSSTCEADYIALLGEEGFEITQDSYGIYDAEQKESGVYVWFYEYADGVLAFEAYNNNPWKYAQVIVEEEYGFALPDHGSDSLEGYYYDVEGASATYFTIYLANASLLDAQSYGATLVQNGFAFVENVEGSNVELDQIYSVGSGAGTRYIRLMFKESLSLMAIAILGDTY